MILKILLYPQITRSSSQWSEPKPEMVSANHYLFVLRRLDFKLKFQWKISVWLHFTFLTNFQRLKAKKTVSSSGFHWRKIAKKRFWKVLNNDSQNRSKRSYNIIHIRTFAYLLMDQKKGRLEHCIEHSNTAR